MRLGGNSVDRGADGRTAGDRLDRSHHLAKVRLAGSNPVLRSQMRLLNLRGWLTHAHKVARSETFFRDPRVFIHARREGPQVDAAIA